MVLLLLHPSLRKAYELLYPSSHSINGNTTGQKPNGTAVKNREPEVKRRFDRRVSFDLGFAIVYIFALHGSSAFKILMILYINFALATRLRNAYVPIATWTFNIGILFANELCRGYPYAGFARLLQPWSDVSASQSGDSWGSYLDSYGGLIPRWEILFNITVLRLISFNLDYYWSSSRPSNIALEVYITIR